MPDSTATGDSPTPRATPSAEPLAAALRAWRQRWLPGADARLGVAFSGGADSTALLLAAHALWPQQVVALHVHHGLQAAADAFESHARDQCAAHGIGFESTRVAARHAEGQSPEDAARLARYRALADMATRHGCAAVWLAQHADDQAETVLLALTRGAGLPGLAAMPARFERHGMVFGRPWLAQPGPQLRDWLQAHGHSHVEDPSNRDRRYTRNRIRAGLLPVLAQDFPAFRDTFARSARHAAQAQRLLEALASADLVQVGQPPRLADLQALSRDRQANLLRHWLRESHGVGASEAQLEALLDQVMACRTRGHRISLKVGDGQVRREGAVLVFHP